MLLVIVTTSFLLSDLLLGIAYMAAGLLSSVTAAMM